MNRSNRKSSRGGHSGLGVLLLVLLAVGAIIGWPMYLDSHGAAATGVITEKRENVRIEEGEWFRRFEILASYSIPGQPLEHRASCDVDENTYDSIHKGNTVNVHYLANLLNQPFLPATHLAPCSAMASISFNPSLNKRVMAVSISLVAILFLWRVLRIRIAAWLLLPWLCLSFAFLVLPRVEPEPRHPVAVTATVDSVRVIRTLEDVDNRTSMKLSHPYQMLRLKFVPPGMDAPVIAIDKVDLDSVPNLKEGQSADIVYDSENPRVARLRGGTRLFPGQALMTVILCCLVFAVFLVILYAGGGVFRFIGRNPLVQAVRANAALRRRQR